MPSTKTYDVAVIGAGVFGAWTAYSLQKSGASVVLLDAYGPASARASSGGESRIIRMGYGADEVYTRWSMHALPLWKELFAHAGRPELFQPTGVLWIAREGEPYALTTLASLASARTQFEQLSNADLRNRYPQIVFDADSCGIFEPQSGVLMARRAVQTVVAEARRFGADYEIEAVDAPAGEGRLAAIKTASGRNIAAGEYVFACGPWLPKVFPEILGGRIFTTRQEIFFFGVPPGDSRFAPPAMPTWLQMRDEFYGMPDLESRGFKIAHDHHGPLVDPDTQSRAATPEALATAREFLARRFPALKDAPILESRVCQYENTSSGDFLIDKHPAFENVWLVGGGSGHGFKHGPSVGEYAAARVTGKTSAALPIDPRFSLATKQTMQQRAVF